MMDRPELEKKAKDLFATEVSLSQKLYDAQEPAPEELGEAAAELSADALLDRLRDTPSRETDCRLLRRAIDGIRLERAKVLRQIAECDAEGIHAYVRVQRRLVKQREEKQRKLLADLFEHEELDPRQAGQLSAAIDHATGLLHVSSSRMRAQTLDAEERRANEVAGRSVDSGVCIATDVQDMIARLIDAGGLYTGRLGASVIGPTLESVREWFAANEKAAAEQSRFGKVTFKLVWQRGEIVLKGRYNVQSGISVEPHRHTETIAPNVDPIPVGKAGVRITETVKR
jgi:hypothetical protein